MPEVGKLTRLLAEAPLGVLQLGAERRQLLLQLLILPRLLLLIPAQLVHLLTQLPLLLLQLPVTEVRSGQKSELVHLLT